MKNTLFFILSALLCMHVSAQQKQDNLQEKLSNHLEIPREVAYLHLNKSTYLKGEQIAFTAYVLNKQNLKASDATNLYIQIKDAKNKVVKEQLFLVEEGVSSNTIKIDSLFTAGNYTLNAFTNWMRNFKEQNYFTEAIKLIEIEDTQESYSVEASEDIDVQFLPESGHLLTGVLNTVGVIAKKENGLGLANADLRITNDQDKVLARFRLNQFGIGKFTFIPIKGSRYMAEISYSGDQTRAFNIEVPIEKNGVILSAITTQDELRLLVKTNRESSKAIKNKKFSLILHNLKASRVYDFTFKNGNTLPFLFNLKEFAPGMNIITLIDSDKKVIAERLFFNHNNLPKTTFSSPEITASSDSLDIKLKPIQALDSVNVSVSVLPKYSIADQHHHSITSYLLLQPYIKGSVQRADWYFNSIDKKKVQELDKLLITQGWSSYDWDYIFNEDFQIEHLPENLLEFEASLDRPRRRNQGFIIHATGNRLPQAVELPANKESFIINNFFHFEDEELAISKIRGNKLIPAGLRIQFLRNTYPELKTNPPFVQPETKREVSDDYQEQPQIIFGKDREILDEVVIEEKINKVKERERELDSKHPWSRVSVIRPEDFNLYNTLGNYLRSKPGINVNEFQGQMVVTSSYNTSAGAPSGGGFNAPRRASAMQLYLDGMPLDNSFFYGFPLVNVDYIEINQTGMGGGFMEAGGSIKIHSNFTSAFESNRYINPQKFEYPVAFSQQRAYYIPKFDSYTSDFYQNYGVIDWKPILKLNEDGYISFKIKKPRVDYQLIVQGISSEGVLIQDVQQITAEK
ncbi:Plug domain-containing protein [Psychroflexus sp. YR1-1]|uniref:Plug domain-containing protein n=1 Tax=Psychroflexus aurantiacus TaxID=2709310 RepID=A0A6B3R5J3_9FLAO|nr:Plug domain-containing protein [Psychroflexus aurantiacus]NEV92654.1 Plug domain-containing protein [Psychroflexus aurantiacus]